MIIGRGHPREVVVVVATFVRNVIIEINNVIMKIKWQEKGQFPMIIGCKLFNMGAKFPLPEDH